MKIWVDIQVEHSSSSKNPKFTILQKSKMFWALTWYHKWKISHLTSCDGSQWKYSKKFPQAWNYLKYCIKLPLHYVMVYKRHNCILYLELSLIPKISHYIYANIPKCERNLKPETLLILHKEYSTCIAFPHRYFKDSKFPIVSP